MIHWLARHEDILGLIDILLVILRHTMALQNYHSQKTRANRHPNANAPFLGGLTLPLKI